MQASEQGTRLNARPRPLLSIYVPTFNRSKWVSRLADNLAKQVGDLADDTSLVEVIIADNCSTDETPQILREAQQRPEWDCTVLRRPKNVGGSANIVQFVIDCRGEFVWLLGDDDRPLPGTLRSIISFLQQAEEDITLVALSLSGESIDGRQLTPPRHAGQTDIAPILSQDVADGSLLAMSALVVRRPVEHGEFTIRFGDNCRFIAPLAIALDALTRGRGQRLPGHHVAQLDANKERWNWRWPSIDGFSVTRLIAEFYVVNSIGKKSEHLINSLLIDKSLSIVRALLAGPGCPKMLFDQVVICSLLIVRPKVLLRMWRQGLNHSGLVLGEKIRLLTWAAVSRRIIRKFLA